MSDIASNPDKKKRKSVPKSSRGCITCKIRHVRCGEEKPACSRCLKSGRQCDGYSPDGRRPTQDPLQIVRWQPNTLALHRISVDIAGNREERQAFHFFREHSAAHLPGFFESSFWNQMVLQASHAEAGIRHAVIALGSLHATVRQDGTLLTSQRACDPFALQQCNKSIAHLNKSLSTNEQHSKEMLLMSCAIFICFESLQGNYESALSHMLGGLRIFRDWQAEASEPSNPRTPSSGRHGPQSVDSEIVQMFSRLNVQTLLFPDTHLFPTDFVKEDTLQTIHPVPATFTTLKEARDCLDNYMSYGLQASVAAYFHRQGSDSESNSNPPQDLTNEHLLPQWSAAFGAFVEKAGPSLRARDLHVAKLLEIQYICAKVLLSVGMPPRESAFDDFRPSFKKIVSLAASVIRGSSSGEMSERAGPFSFETGLVPPLYFTATRCRDPRIRREALSLLSARPRQECIWNSEMLSKIAERLILIEEQGDSIGQGTSEEGGGKTSRLTVLNATICSEKGQVLVACSQQKWVPDEEMRFFDERILY